MKRPLALALLGALLLPAPLLRADEPPYLDFVKGLRERHYPDLALEYLQDLSKKTNLPPEVAARLPLEMAQAQMDMAQATTDANQRLSLFQEARAKLDEFVQKNPQSPLVNTVKAEIARVAVRIGQAKLSQALRRETKEARISEAAAARKLLEDAGKQLQGVVPSLKAQVDNYPDPKTPQQKKEKQELEDALTQAQLDVALNFLDQSRTYLETGKDEVDQARNKVLDQATPILKSTAAGDEKSPLTWVARAWLGRREQMSGAPKEARRQYAAVIGEARPQAAAGQRLARYFRMLVILEAPDPGENQWKEVYDAGTIWLRLYPTFRDTPEGYGVRYWLAQAEIEQAKLVKGAARRPFLDAAKTLCHQLEETDNDYQGKARDLKIAIIKEEGGFAQPVATLTTFDDCYVRAQYEDSLLSAKDTTEEKRKQHLKSMIEALNRGLELARKEKAPESDVSNARAALTFAYLEDGALLDSIRVGEELARLPARPPASAKGAVYALHAYSEVIAAPEQAKVPQDQLKDYQDRQRQLAEFAIQNWPNENAGDVGRHELGLFYIHQEKYPEAVQVLASIRPGYAAAIFSKYQLAMAAYEAEKNKAKPVEGADQRPWPQQALDALTSIPDLAKDADPGTTYIYVLARMKLGQQLWLDKKYDELDKLVAPLLQQLPSLNFDTKERRDEVQTGLSTLRLYALYGRADREYSAGHYDVVGTMIDQVVKDVQADKLPEVKKDPKLRWALLGLGLKADVQQGKMDAAQGILDILQGSADDLEGGQAATLVQLAQLLRTQLDEVRKKTPDKVEDTKKTFAGFLDKLTERQKGKALAPEITLLLANSYAGLDNHKRAAEMLGAVPEPAAGAPQKDQDAWQYIRVACVRELRQDKQLDKAKAELQKILDAPWGAKNLEAQKEKLQLEMAEEHYIVAARGWNSLITNLAPKMSQPGMKEQYLECYYNLTYAMYKHGQKLKAKDPAKGTATIKQAAGYINTLESRWPDFGGEASKTRFTELLDREPELKEQYAQLKNGQ